MSDPMMTLERIADRIPIPEPAYERFQRRHDRKRRNQRIMAGAVGMAMFVASALLITTTIGPLGRTAAPLGGGNPGNQWDGIGIPPEGTPLSTPARAELIAEANTVFRVGSVSAYADGRVVWLTNGSAHAMERRLTPAGVELVRSGAVTARDLFPPQAVHGLPASAWADAAPKPYAPARYAVCTSEPPSQVLDMLPASARALLRGTEQSFQGDGLIYDADELVECFGLAAEDARELDDILGGAGWISREAGGITAVTRELPDPEASQGRVLIDFMPLFPDGRFHTAGGG